MVLTLESVDEFLSCDLYKTARERIFSMMLFNILYKVVLTFESMWIYIVFSILYSVFQYFVMKFFQL